LVAEGSTNAGTALQLNLSVRTIEVHRSRLMRKLNLKNQAELMRFAVQRGIVTL
jgi:DNA-binding NarL/FixJ family response regulator